MIGAMQETERIAEGILIHKTRNHLSYTQVADILGIKRQSLARRMKGDTKWKHEELHKLADAWGITIQQLETGFGENNTNITADP